MHGKGRAVGSRRKSPFLSQATNEHQEKPSQTACPITAVTKLGVLSMGGAPGSSPLVAKSEAARRHPRTSLP